MVYTHRIAYTYSNGEVEGFKGTGPSAETAYVDAMNQLVKKIAIIQITRPDEPACDRTRIVTDFAHKLTDEQWETVKRDWRSNVRY